MTTEFFEHYHFNIQFEPTSDRQTSTPDTPISILICSRNELFEKEKYIPKKLSNTAKHIEQLPFTLKDQIWTPKETRAIAFLTITGKEAMQAYVQAPPELIKADQKVNALTYMLGEEHIASDSYVIDSIIISLDEEKKEALRMRRNHQGDILIDTENSPVKAYSPYGIRIENEGKPHHIQPDYKQIYNTLIQPFYHALIANLNQIIIKKVDEQLNKNNTITEITTFSELLKSYANHT